MKTTISLILPLVAVMAWMPMRARATDMTVDTPLDVMHYNGGCTLRDAIENATSRDLSGSGKCKRGTGNDTIRFKAGVDTVTLDPVLGEIDIGEDVVLDIGGDGHPGGVELNGASGTRIFRINGSGTRIYFHELNFRDGNAMTGGRGGAVYIDGAKGVDFIDVAFERNRAPEGGGALAVDGGGTALSILDTVFKDNESAGDMNGDNGWGGAIDMREVTIAVIDNTDFIGNRARSGGGAIHCDTDANSAMLAISGGLVGKSKGLFQQNVQSAPNTDVYGPFGGGAIDNHCPMRIRHIRFDRNLAFGKGGAIYQRSGGFPFPALIEGSTFEKNGFLETGGVSGNGIGGAIAAEGGIDVEDSSFAGNSAVLGGAIAVRDTQLEEVVIASSSILHNEAALAGGAMYLRGAIDATVWHVTIDGNAGLSSVHFETPSGSAVVEVANSILSPETGRPMCGGAMSSVATANSNLQTGDPGDDSCFGPSSGSIHGDPDFLSVAEAGFYPNTIYFAIGSGGAAASAGDVGICELLEYDQIGAPRDAAHCSIGAVEP